MHGPVLVLSGQMTITRSLVADVGLKMLAMTEFDILMNDYDYSDVVVDMIENSR